MTCKHCPKRADRDGFCKGCRIKSFIVMKYPFTPELDRKLTKAYREHNGRGKIEALNELVRITRYPRYIFLNRANTLGLKTRTYVQWTQAEIEYIEIWAGEKSLRAMSEHLKRPTSAIKHKILDLGMSTVVTSGFTRQALADLFGVHHRKIDGWIGRGLLVYHEQDQLVPHWSVANFVWDHMGEYRFATCEEWWLKMMLKPAPKAERPSGSIRFADDERQVA